MISAAQNVHNESILFGDHPFRYCDNYQFGVCNWLVPADSNVQYCSACKLNRTIPNLSNSLHYQAWKNIERAKHRAIYNIQCLRLPVLSKVEAPEEGLAFEFLASSNETSAEESVQTGHFKGIITINLNEADSVHRELIRKQMSEPYRTLIGHFRHELGHYYWKQLMLNENNLTSFRELFGDETRDYGAALDDYYQYGFNSNWKEHFISRYATSHPWEDWAETWAHYLHIMDTLETAFAFGINTDPHLRGGPPMSMESNFDPYKQVDFNTIINAFLPLTFAINSINRSIGISDIYPFTLSPTVIKKLNFIHNLLKAGQEPAL
jgi:hypothetical protein